MTTSPPAPETIALADVRAAIDARCAPILEHLRRHRPDLPAGELDAAVPALDAPLDEWLAFHAQVHRWLATDPSAASPGAGAPDAQADADALAALRRAPIPVAGTALAVHPKSFATLLHLVALDRRIDGLAALVNVACAPDASAALRDALDPLTEALARAVALCVWTWTTPGVALPFNASDPDPAIPTEILSLEPSAILEVHRAVHAMLERHQAVHALLDPLPAGGGGSRPSWAATFHALGVSLSTTAHDLQVAYAFDEVIAMAQLEASRRSHAGTEATT